MTHSKHLVFHAQGVYRFQDPVRGAFLRYFLPKCTTNPLPMGARSQCRAYLLFSHNLAEDHLSEIGDLLHVLIGDAEIAGGKLL